jgi:CBS domain-containing protein
MPIVKQVMCRDPAVVHVDQPLVEAARRMRGGDVGALFVVDGDELVGMVTDRDLVLRGVATGRDPLAVAVIDVMTRHVVFCEEHCSLEEAGRLMARQQIRRLAVVDGDRELVGVLSLGDLARAETPPPIACAAALGAICEKTTTAKTPAREDATGGRRRGSPPGELHVYRQRPHIRRRPFFEP